MQLELLSPAKNLEFGREAINHGADAVYIGAKAYGARTAAGNSIKDIEALAQYAHLYHSKVFATVNTLLFDEEVECAVKLMHQLYNAGVDAAIVQDPGLLLCDLPPIELHSSTQMHNVSVERIKFMEQVGFSRVILAREISLEQMRAIRSAVNIELEAFVQGALCVSYSGQCYMSQYLNERSGNRGCCGQPCRSTYDLYNEKGQLLIKEQHLLSLKDFSAVRHLNEMIDAGITSFKIEGRLKDLSYVKNVTAYYRRLLNDIMAVRNDCKPASSGETKLFFVPDLEKTFNRGFTEYFLKDRHNMASMATQKSIGKKLGRVTKIEHNVVTVKTNQPMTAGDGICFFNANGNLEGFMVNQVRGNNIIPHRLPNMEAGTELWRNNDFTFEKQLQGRSAERKVTIKLLLSDTSNGIMLTFSDSDGCQASATIECEKSPAINTKKATEQIERQLTKMGDTIFTVQEITNHCKELYFIPAAILNGLRRKGVSALEESRISAHLQQRGTSPTLTERQSNSVPYYEQVIDYRANILNSKSEQFYRQHGVQELTHGLEETKNYEGKALMTTKYCLRYELGCCFKSSKLAIEGTKDTTLYLRNNKNWFELRFDCKHCQMQVLLAKDRHLEGKRQ